MKDFPNKLKLLRKQKKVTQAALAEYLEICATSAQRLEYGIANPSLTTIIKIADYFNVSLDYLTGRTDNPEINSGIQEDKQDSESRANVNKLLDKENSEDVFKTVSLLLKLDDFDKGKITERIKVFLESDKYLKD